MGFVFFIWRNLNSHYVKQGLIPFMNFVTGNKPLDFEALASWREGSLRFYMWIQRKQKLGFKTDRVMICIWNSNNLWFSLRIVLHTFLLGWESLYI